MKKHLVLINTTRCQFHCKHCIRDYYAQHADISLELLEPILSEAWEMGIEQIALTGGEPCLHPHFYDMIDMLVNKGYQWSSVTNGWQPEPYLDVLENNPGQCTFISVSFDGVDAQTHDYIRQPGSFEKAWAAVDAYKHYPITVKAAFTVNKRNIDQVEDFIALAKAHGVDEVRLAGIIPNHFNQALALSWKQKTRIYAFIQKVKEDAGIKITFTTSLYTFTETKRFCDNLNNPEPVINPFGEYLLCCDTAGRGAVVGDLQKNSFGELYVEQIKLATQIRRQRDMMIADKDFINGFNSCTFCNTLLGDRIIHPNRVDEMG